jgi:lipoate-protein ligase A
LSWRVERVPGPAGTLHARPLAVERTLVWCDVERPAVVLGSAQRDEVTAPDGVDVVRRRSGGGAVLLVPGDVVWADVTIPAGDPLWESDVARAFWWVGDAWAAALRALGVDARVHRGAPVRTPWSRQVCFAGVGSGEVTVGGRKVVGVSQRRTREAALFQCACLLRWDPVALVDALGLGAGGDVADVAVGLAEVVGSVDGAAVEAALVDQLP